MGFKVCFFVILVCFLLVPETLMAQDMNHASIFIDGARLVSETDENFVCATLDWWPHDKCNYNQCPWGYSSVINMDLSRPLLTKAVQAFKPLRIRIGGSLQDQVIYDVGNLKTPCHPFRKMNSGLFGFSKGCLHMKRWDELNQFLTTSGAIVTFGLNALHGRHKLSGNAWGGAWDHTNTQDFINYTLSKGYPIDSWEFGNELSGSGVGASVSADLYGKDLIVLKDVINKVYKDSKFKPWLVAPGGFYEQQWYAKLLQISGPRVVDVVTHHIYNLGSGNDPELVKKILDPSYLSKISETFKNVNATIQEHGPWASAWVGESGGAYNSGGRLVSDTFIDSFWYLDQLGMSSKHNTKVYCRQTLVGGNYGLLEKDTFVPNPDYYSALLWHRLMGRGVLSVQTDGPPQLRVYAHCSKGRGGVTVLVINLSKQSAFTVSISNGVSIVLKAEPMKKKKKSLLDTLKKHASWIGKRALDGYLKREEYHLTPKDGELRSKTMLLNGKALEATASGDIPSLEPVNRGVESPVEVLPLSMSFIILPNFDAPACS